MADTTSERSVHALAIFVDFENLALGFQGRRDRFDIQRVIRRMVDKGKIVVKKAYADWGRYSSYTSTLHEAAIELIEIPRRVQSGKNSADIRLVVDAMDLAYSKDHIDTFIIVSGDSDFTPLVSKLKELGKHVIGTGMQGSTSDLLRDNCDEFIYYEDLEGESAEVSTLVPAHLPENKRKAFALLLDALVALRRENKEALWSSMVKDTMKRKKPSFNETYHGYQSFSALLEDAEREGLVELEKHKRSGTYVVARFGEELKDGGRSRPEHREHPDRPDRPEGDSRRGGRTGRGGRSRRPDRGPERRPAPISSDPDRPARPPARRAPLRPPVVEEPLLPVEEATADPVPTYGAAALREVELIDEPEAEHPVEPPVTPEPTERPAPSRGSRGGRGGRGGPRRPREDAPPREPAPVDEAPAPSPRAAPRRPRDREPVPPPAALEAHDVVIRPLTPPADHPGSLGSDQPAEESRNEPRKPSEPPRSFGFGIFD